MTLGGLRCLARAQPCQGARGPVGSSPGHSPGLWEGPWDGSAVGLLRVQHRAQWAHAQLQHPAILVALVAPSPPPGCPWIIPGWHPRPAAVPAWGPHSQHPHTNLLCWSPRPTAGPHGGTPWEDPTVGPHGRTPKWDPMGFISSLPALHPSWGPPGELSSQVQPTIPVQGQLRAVCRVLQRRAQGCFPNQDKWLSHG